MHLGWVLTRSMVLSHLLNLQTRGWPLLKKHKNNHFSAPIAMSYAVIHNRISHHIYHIEVCLRETNCNLALIHYGFTRTNFYELPIAETKQLPRFRDVKERKRMAIHKRVSEYVRKQTIWQIDPNRIAQVVQREMKLVLSIVPENRRIVMICKDVHEYY